MNPFLRWLPMYAPGAILERPTWRIARLEGDRILIRADGVVGTNFGSLISDRSVRESALYSIPALREIDKESPLPPPLPMLGQVWHQVTDGGRYPDAGDVFSVVSFLRGKPVVILQDGEDPLPCVSDVWPPQGAVLVSGPTPWGRDVPWHPADWRPE